ncbi:MAG: GAP family protein [Rubrobacter sp.]
MGDAIGDILPLALAVTISPIPNVAMILVLFSPRARTNGPAFLVGWIAGLVLVGVLATILSGSAGLGSGSGESSVVGSLLKILLGLVLLWLASRSFRKRPRPGEQPPLPGWMRAIDSASAAKVFGIAVLLSVNPKNLLFTVAAAVTIVQEGLILAGAAFTLAVFTIVASLGIAILLALYLAGGASARAKLDRLRVWLNANNATVMAVLLLVLGVVLLGQSLGGLFG